MSDKFRDCKHPDCLTEKSEPCRLPKGFLYCHFCGAFTSEKDYICPNKAILQALYDAGGRMHKDDLLSVASRCVNCGVFAPPEGEAAGL